MEQKDNLEIIFHAGVLTIGGTIIEITYKDAHLFFDFGTEFRPELSLPDENLETLIENGLIPDLQDIYDQRMNHIYKGEERRRFSQSAVFLSHAHLDHSRMINYLDPEIPLYALNGTDKILKTLNSSEDFLLPSPFEEKQFTREISPLEAYESVELGEITVKIIPVDHDAYAATGLIIEAGGKKIAYTGDIRLHGYSPEDSIEFCRRAFRADALIMEGVSISFPEREKTEAELLPSSEVELIENLVQLVEDNPQRQITFNGYPANLKRFEQIVQKSPRKVVLTAEMAKLLLDVFKLKVHYYLRQSDLPFEELDSSYEVPYQELLEDKQNYLWQVTDDFYQLQAGGLYIHSDASPLGDFDPNYAKFLDMLEKHQIEFTRLSCSGHAFPNDLDKIISLIEPQLLLPIHSLHPEKLENPYGRRFLPNRGQKIIL